MFIVWVYVDGNMISNEKFDTRDKAEKFAIDLTANKLERFLLDQV